MEKHREIMKQSIEAQQCIGCKDIFFNLIIHHIDGNRKNNSKENLIPLCKKCHSFVHHRGLNKKFCLDIPLKLREIWLMNKKGISKKKAKQIIVYETWMAGKCWICPKSYCSLCKKNKNLVYYLPSEIRKLIPIEKHKTYGITFCKSCLKKILRETKHYLK